MANDLQCLECGATVRASGVTEQQEEAGVAVFCESCGATYWIESGKDPVCVDTRYPSVFAGTMY